LIPEEALGSDQGERFVFLADAESRVEYRRVTVGWREAGQRVIESGVAAGDRVILTNLQRLRAKDEVQPSLREPPPAAESPGTADAGGATPRATPGATHGN
jgi:hypothetical protein